MILSSDQDVQLYIENNWRECAQDFIDGYIEKKYLSALWINKISFGLFKVREPHYLYNGGWHD